MARSTKQQKDLSMGWKRLHGIWKWSLEKKVRYSLNLLTQIFKEHENPVLCWSGGKDSTVVLHLARLLWPNIPIIYVDTGVEFPESSEFVRLLVEKWKLNFTIVEPLANEKFWTLGERYGWPIFGKSISSNVERAVKTGNIRPQLSALEKLLAINKTRISCRCTEFLQEKPSKRAEKDLDADVKIIGLRASESRARVRLWVDYGDHYYVKRYFGRGNGIWKVNPIATWTEQDIWNYHETNTLSHCKLYDIGYPRNGCWPCAMGVVNGQLKRLNSGHPKLFEYLMNQTAMGEELRRIRGIFLSSNSRIGFSLDKLF